MTRDLVCVDITCKGKPLSTAQFQTRRRSSRWAAALCSRAERGRKMLTAREQPPPRQAPHNRAVAGDQTPRRMAPIRTGRHRQYPHCICRGTDDHLLTISPSERQWGTVREITAPTVRRGTTCRMTMPGCCQRVERRRAAVVDVGAAAVPWPGAVDATRSDLEGASVRADRGTRESRRGREGILVVSGRGPESCLEPLALSLSAGGVSVSGPDRSERAAQ